MQRITSLAGTLITVAVIVLVLMIVMVWSGFLDEKTPSQTIPSSYLFEQK